MRDGLLIRLTADPLDPSEALSFVAHPGAGGTVLFTGTVRDHSDSGPVTGLTYEAWEQSRKPHKLVLRKELQLA